MHWHAHQASAEEARAQLDEAIRLRDEARELAASRNIPETRVHATEAEVAISEAALARLQVEVREQRTRLQRHAVVAPFDAVVSRKLTEAGAMGRYRHAGARTCRYPEPAA
ncbi:MAG: hypothetical protein U5P41_12675 [Gammaproteobacteria bacterium]|nr:hypothetical protein [Gammaproteobacteria bacterium]